MVFCAIHIAPVTSHLKIVVEKQSDGYVAYSPGLARVVILDQGDRYEAALSDVRSAIDFHAETFGMDLLHKRRTTLFGGVRRRGGLPI